MDLPPLSPDEIEKFDNLLFFLKQNDNGFIDIMTYCNQQWGDNYKLYYSFSYHLRINSLTLVSNYSEFSQTISQKGKAFKSFKRAYRIKKIKDLFKDFNEYFEFITKPLLTLITLAATSFGIYQYISATKFDKVLKEQKTTIDSLTTVVIFLRQDSINKHPTQMDKTKMVDTSKGGH